MLELVIAEDDLSDDGVVAFLLAHLADMHATSPPGSVHAFDVERLRGPGIRFWVARRGGVLVGTAALARLDEEHAELKSMRTDPAVRRQGVAAALLAHAVAAARSDGFARLSLETGAQDAFAPARAMYARHGFVECPPFGDYRADPASTFMTRTLR